MGPCMCGDILCSSCGPAQGYHPCPYCGYLDMGDIEDDFETLDIQTGCYCSLEILLKHEEEQEAWLQMEQEQLADDLESDH